MKQVNIACRAADILPLEKLTVIQGDLKKLSEMNIEKLKKSILKYGFSAPIFIWESGIKKPKYNILDGTQRVTVLKMMQKDGYKIPDLLVVYISAKNKKEAMEKLLHITSQYGEFDREGLDSFLLGIDATEELLETLRLSEADILYNTEPEVIDYSDLDTELESLADIKDTSIEIVVPAKYETKVIKWLSNGEQKHAAGLGRGVLKRCGLL